MKFETKIRENYSQVFLSIKIPFIPKTFRLNSMLYSTPETWVHGYSSRTKNGRYVLLHDFDSVELFDIVEEIKWLQNKFSLSDYYLFKMPDRDESFHACCIDTFPLAKVYEIQKHTSCDSAFIHSIKLLKTKEWILRFGPKGLRESPQFLKTIKSKHDSHTKSTAHGQLLKKMGISINLKKGKWDGIQELGFVDYNTSNRTEVKKK